MLPSGYVLSTLLVELLEKLTKWREPIVIRLVASERRRGQKPAIVTKRTLKICTNATPIKLHAHNFRKSSFALTTFTYIYKFISQQQLSHLYN